MNNKSVELFLQNCKQELEDIKNIKKIVGSTSTIMMFLTRYSLIKVCGTLELSYKTIIADFCETSQSDQVKNFISNKIRNNPKNPTINNIINILRDFSIDWSEKFKEKLNNEPNSDKIKFSIKSLNDARNEFAHGGNPNIAFENLEDYFDDASILIQLLDDVVK